MDGFPNAQNLKNPVKELLCPVTISGASNNKQNKNAKASQQQLCKTIALWEKHPPHHRGVSVGDRDHSNSKRWSSDLYRKLSLSQQMCLCLMESFVKVFSCMCHKRFFNMEFMRIDSLLMPTL